MNKLEALRCIEITSQRQADNGTVCYHDPVTGVDYLSYDSGYIRRAYDTKSWRTGKKLRTIYQLNPVRKGIYTTQFGVNYDTTVRVMIKDPQERLDRLAKAVSNYRITLKKQREEAIAWQLKKDKENSQNSIMNLIQESVSDYFDENISFEEAVAEIEQTIGFIK